MLFSINCWKIKHFVRLSFYRCSIKRPLKFCIKLIFIGFVLSKNILIFWPLHPDPKSMPKPKGTLTARSLLWASSVGLEKVAKSRRDHRIAFRVVFTFLSQHIRSCWETQANPLAPLKSRNADNVMEALTNAVFNPFQIPTWLDAYDFNPFWPATTSSGEYIELIVPIAQKACQQAKEALNQENDQFLTYKNRNWATKTF